MYVSAFQRVLVAGFVTGGTEDIDANQETVRLLRSQLRTKSSLKVIDADLLPLMEVVSQDQGAPAEADESSPTTRENVPGRPAGGASCRCARSWSAKASCSARSSCSSTAGPGPRCTRKATVKKSCTTSSRIRRRCRRISS